MPTDLDGSRDAAAAPLAQLQRIFDADELALRKTLQADHPVLFRYLKRNV
jgi:hypothetical protein